MRHAFLIIAWACVALPALAQEQAVATIPFDGTEVFCHVLNFENLTPLASSKDLMRQARQSMLIVFGDPANLQSAVIQPFLENGGSLLLATDRLYSPAGIAVRFEGDRAISEKQCYRDQSSCPLLRAEQLTEEGSDHRLFRGLHQGIATNCPSRLHVTPAKSGGAARIVPLCSYPASMIRVGKRNENWFADAGDAMAGSPDDARPAGRCLFIGGHGLFMNSMMLQRDSDNFAFALNAVRWLREGPEGRRTKALFVVDGTILTNFDANLAPQPIMPLPPIRALDRLLRGLENERFFHRVFEHYLGAYRDDIASILFAVVTFAVMVYGAKKFLDGRYAPEALAPRMVGVVPDLGAIDFATQQRAALGRQSDLGGEAILLARAWFRQEFGIAPAQWERGEPIELIVRGGFWGSGAVRKNAERVRQLAVSSAPAALTRRAFARLERTLPDLSAARRAGRLALLVAGKTLR